MENTYRLALALLILAGVALAGCVPTPAPTVAPTRASTPAPTAAPTIPAAVVQPVDPAPLVATRAFEVVASGAPAVAPEAAKPLMVVLAAGDPVPALLPDEARQALTKAVSVKEDALYLVVYLGPQPSAGYSVRIVSVLWTLEAGVPKLAVTYLVDRPDPAKGAASVVTHPYVIAKVRGIIVDPANATFQPQ